MSRNRRKPTPLAKPEPVIIAQLPATTVGERRRAAAALRNRLQKGHHGAPGTDTYAEVHAVIKELERTS